MKRVYMISLGIAFLIMVLVSGVILTGCGEATVHDIAILNATCSATSVTAGENVTITFDIENRGAGNVTLPYGWRPESDYIKIHLPSCTWIWILKEEWLYPRYYDLDAWVPGPFELAPDKAVTAKLEWDTTGFCTGDYTPVLNLTLDGVTDANPEDNVAVLNQVEITNEEQPYEIDSLVELLRYCQLNMTIGAPDPMDIYVVYIDDEDGWEYRDDFAAAIAAGNYTGHFSIVGQQSVAPTSTDVTTELAAANVSGADVLCAFVHPPVSELIVTGAADLGVDFEAMVVALGASSDEFWMNTAGDAEGVIGFGAGEIPWCRWQIGQWQSGTFEVIAPPEEATASPVYPMP